MYFSVQYSILFLYVIVRTQSFISDSCIPQRAYRSRSKSTAVIICNLFKSPDASDELPSHMVARAFVDEIMLRYRPTDSPPTSQQNVNVRFGQRRIGLRRVSSVPVCPVLRSYVSRDRCRRAVRSTGVGRKNPNVLRRTRGTNGTRRAFDAVAGGCETITCGDGDGGKRLVLDADAVPIETYSNFGSIDVVRRSRDTLLVADTAVITVGDDGRLCTTHD